MKGKAPVSAEERAQLLTTRRLRKMAKSAHAYVRGNTAQFYEWLDELNGSVGVPNGPPVWICGDCHLGNLGPLADERDRIDIQIRDLDQSVIGNPAHDLIRLALSLESAARGSDLPGVATAHIIEAMIQGYSRALEGKPNNGAHGTPDMVRAVKRRAYGASGGIWRRNGSTDRIPGSPSGRDFGRLTRAREQTSNVFSSARTSVSSSFPLAAAKRMNE